MGQQIFGQFLPGTFTNSPQVFENAAIFGSTVTVTGLVTLSAGINFGEETFSASELGGTGTIVLGTKSLYIT